MIVRGSAVVTAVVLATAALTVVSPPTADAKRTASPRAASWSWGVNGPVYAVAVTGRTLVVGGAFTAVVSQSGASLPRRNLAAFSLPSGRPLTGWSSDTDGTVFALDASATSVWVGGAFDAIGGSTRAHLAKVALADGTVDPSFVLDTSGTVRALARSHGRLFAGGDFLQAQEERHEHLVAASAATGVVDPGFQAAADGTVRGLDHAGDCLYAVGRFQRLNGRLRPGIGCVDVLTGATAGPTFRFPGAPRQVKALVVSVDDSAHGRRVVAGIGGKPKDGVGNQVVSWRTDTGRPVWRVRLGGDGQAVRVSHGTAYVGFHRSYRGDRRLHLLAVDAHTGRVSATFRPRFSGFWGVRAIATSRCGVVVGGQFARVDSTVRNRMALFPFEAGRGQR